WNPGAERIKGYRAQEIRGRHYSCFYPEEALRAGTPAHLLQVAAAEGRCEDEGWRLRKDGSRFWANVVITAVRDGAGRLRGFSKGTRDLTEPRRAQEALEEKTRALEAAQEALVRRPADPGWPNALGGPRLPGPLQGRGSSLRAGGGDGESDRDRAPGLRASV